MLFTLWLLRNAICVLWCECYNFHHCEMMCSVDRLKQSCIQYMQAFGDCGDFCCSFRCMQLFVREVVYVTHLKSVEFKGYPNMQNSHVCSCLMATSKDTSKWERKSQTQREQLANSCPVD